jgi:hypothetical protein
MQDSIVFNPSNIINSAARDRFIRAAFLSRFILRAPLVMHLLNRIQIN